MENIFVEFLPPWVETGLQPAFYDKESGTVLQQTARMYARVNMLIRMFNKLSKQTKTEVENFEQSTTEKVNDYINRFNELHDYVQDYFANLDVQDEINNKLDEMAQDGTLQEIIATYLQSNVSWTFDTVAEMKLATNLVDGSYAQTLGFHTINDGGGAVYYITDAGTANEMDVIAVDTLYANLVTDPEEINVKQFGAYGDDTHDDLTSIQRAINYGKANGKFNIYLPDGNYDISNALIIPDNISLHGSTIFNGTTITKTTNNTDSTYNVDAIVIFKKDDDASYNSCKEIKNLLLKGNQTNTYGVYSYDAHTRVVYEDCRIFRVITGIYWRTGGWLSTFRRVTINPISNGFYFAGGSSTTLTLDSTYVNGGDGYGYYFKGIGYSGMNNVACDGNTGTPYFFNFANLTINGFGCECPNANCAIEGAASSYVRINNGTVTVNPTDSNYKCIKIGGSSDWEINDVIFHDYGENNDETAGRFLNAGSGANISFSNCRLDKKFATANYYSDSVTTQKLSTRNGEFYYNGQNDISGIGNFQFDTATTNFYERANLTNYMGGILFNNRGGVRYSLSGSDRRYKPAHNLGDIFVNQAPALNGIAMFQQTSDSQPREMAGSITSVNISGTTGTITLDTLNLTDFSKNRGLVVESGHDIESSSGGTASITGVNFDTTTLTLSNVNGSFDVSDSIVYKGKTNIGNSTYSNIQSIGYGTTAQRPSQPVNGYMYWDTTLGKAIWRVGNNWKDATGANV